jgi:hypothetical protein
MPHRSRASNGARGLTFRGSLTLRMRQKLATPSGVRIDAPCSVDTGKVRRQDVASRTGQADTRRRLRSTGAPNAQRRRKSKPAPLIGSGPPTFAGVGVVDDFPTAIPVTPRELDVIETYLGALLDDALGKRE